MLSEPKKQEVLIASTSMTKEMRKKYIVNLFMYEAYALLYDLAKEKGENTKEHEEKMDKHGSRAEKIWLESFV